MKFILVFIFFQLTLLAQNSTIGSVNYGHKQSLGLGAPVGIDYNATLAFNTEASVYVCKKDSLEGGHVNEFVTSRNKDVISLSQKVTNEKGFIYFYDRKNNLSKSRDIGLRYVNEKTPKINWVLTNETKEIGKFLCKKAVAHFRGREYTAWYSREIPVPYGPWKLQGLPGLILEAYDTNKEIYFYFKSIEYPSKNKVYINEPDPKLENKSWISINEYKEQTIRAYERGVENGRMISEGSGASIIESKKPLMKNAYLEVFKD